MPVRKSIWGRAPNAHIATGVEGVIRFIIGNEGPRDKRFTPHVVDASADCPDPEELEDGVDVSVLALGVQEHLQWRCYYKQQSPEKKSYQSMRRKLGKKMNALGPYLPDVAGRRLPQAERLAHAQSRSVKKNQHEQRVLLIIVIYLKIKV